MDFPGGSGREQPQLPPMTPLPLARQGSVYSLTFDKFQSTLGGVGKDFGSMNMDELLRNIWTAEESHAIAVSTTTTTSSSAAVDHAAGAPIQRQGSLTLPRTLSQMTVDEVWRDMMCFGAPSAAPAQRQQTLGEITLEEFLVRAGVAREDMAGPPPVPPAPAPAARVLPPPPHPPVLFPQSNVFAPMLPPLSLGNGLMAGAVGQGGGGPATVVSPVRSVTSNGFGKVEGEDLSSLSPPPVPYVFNGGPRGRKVAVMEKVVERRQRRMIKNRESASRSRQRKQAYMMELEAEVAKLKELNEELQKKQVEMLEKQKNEVLEKITRSLPGRAAPSNYAMPKGAKKRAKLKKQQQGGHPAGSDDGGNNDDNGSNNSSRRNAASDGNHLPIPPNIPPVDVSEDSMESSEEMVTPRAAASEADEEEKKAAASEVPVERAVEVVEVVEEDGTGGEAREEVMVDALPPEAGEQEQEGKVDAKAEAHAVVQEPEVQDVVVAEAPAVQEPEEVVVREVAKVHPVHEPETKGEEVVLRETATASGVQEPEAKGDGVVVMDAAEVSHSCVAAVARTTEVVRGPAVAVAAAGHRAAWWNCCGLFDAFAGSER